MIGSDRELGRMLTQLRGERTQQAIADAMRERGWRWSQATVWSVEKGERPLKLREAAMLTTILGTTLEALLRGDGSIFLSEKLSAIHDKIVTLQEELREANSAVEETERRLRLAMQERQLVLRELRETNGPSPLEKNLQAAATASDGGLDDGDPTNWVDEEDLVAVEASDVIDPEA